MKNKTIRQAQVKSGFTLIELLISMTIGMLVIGFGSMALNNFNEQQKVEIAKQELLANLRLARNYATTNQLANGGDRIVVTIDTDGIIGAITQDKDNYDVGISFFSKDITPDGVNVSASVISFSATEGRSIGGTLNIGVSGSSSVKNIKIDESGLIYEQ